MSSTIPDSFPLPCLKSCKSTNTAENICTIRWQCLRYFGDTFYLQKVGGNIAHAELNISSL